MHATLATLLDRLDSAAVSGTDVIPWGSPVPAFGDVSACHVATLGLNPSNREFVDEAGNELDGPLRRFHTLRSLGLRSWSDVDAGHLRLILQSCRTYFEVNPYNTWFRRLDDVLAGASASYYGSASRACHLDLIPYATARKWTQLTLRQRSALLAAAADTFACLLRDSVIRILILNGTSVVTRFEEVADVVLERRAMRSWSLARKGSPDILGHAYSGLVSRIAGVDLGHDVLVLGFNHNLQGSFGVTTQVIAAIRDWVSRLARSIGA